jgi:phosphopentomutase
MPLDKIVVVVLDGVGAGEMPDAAAYGDQGSDTLGNMAREVGGLRLPNLAAAGLGNLHAIAGVAPATAPRGAFGRMAEASAGKDTTTGHWEMAGVVTPVAMPTFAAGFPPEIIEPYEAAIGRKVLGNKPASGTAVIEELGEEHLRTGRPIVYTSADSVFQVAAHEEAFGLEELYRICAVARQQLDRWRVGRVIARPFVGAPGAFKRTYNRRDYSLEPPPNVLDALCAAGVAVVGIGKISDIFAGRSVPRNVHTEGNADGIERTIDETRALARGLVFSNLVDFDMLYGHRNDVPGMAAALAAFDARLPALCEAAGPRGAVVVTADHGNDPTTTSTDHSREYVPLLCVGGGVRAGVDLGVRRTFADLGCTLAENFGVDAGAAVTPSAQSFLADIGASA